MNQEDLEYEPFENEPDRYLLPQHVSLKTGVLYDWWVKHHRRREDGKLVVAVSGGSDSMAMLYLCLPPETERDRVVIGHIHHGTGEFADEAYEFLTGVRDKLGLRLIKHEVCVSKEQIRMKGFEAAARKERYASLNLLASRVHAETVFVGHTVDDVMETLFINLMRGSGIGGLSGPRPGWWEWSQKIPDKTQPGVWQERYRLQWMRPLLHRGREDLRAFLQHEDSPFLDDPSNIDDRYTRSAVRTRIAPVIRETFGEGAIRNISRSAFHLHKTDMLLSAEAKRVYSEVLRRRTPGWASIDARKCVGYLDELVSRVLFRALADVHGVRPDQVYLDRKDRRRLLTLVRSWKSGTSRRIAGVTITVRDDLELSIYDESTRIRMIPPGHFVLPDGSEIHVELETVNPGAVSRVQGSGRPGFVERLDADLVGLAVIVQPWQRGDTFHPLGSKNENVRVVRRLRRPAHERIGPLWVMRTESGVIAWVLGERIAEPFRVTDNSRRILIFRYDPPALDPAG